jgi:adenylate kinase
MGLYLIIMGVQGAGKGTQAAFIQKQYGIPQVSTGDLFRAMKTREDDLAKRVQEIMTSGALVPDDVTNEVLKDRLEQPDAENGVILDGYPRNIAQAQWLAKHLKGRGEKLAAVLLLTLDGYTAFKRAFGRVKDSETGDTFNIYFNDGRIDWTIEEDENGTFSPRIVAKDTKTGRELARRKDDHAVAVVKRIDTYFAETMPLVEHYRAQDLLVEVDAEQSIEAVSGALKAEIDKVSAR